MPAKLAIDGGTPVRERMLPYARQTIDSDDVRAVTQALGAPYLTTGPGVAEFEAAFAAAVGARFAIAVSSGTAALHTAAFAAGLAAGHEAITTPMTFAASANCILYQGARAVFADVRRDTLNLDPEQTARLVTERTRAIVAVDFAGHPADLDTLGELAESRGLILIEDAAHSLGATWQSRPVGTLARLTTFSFHPAKHITSGEGGMVTTDDPELAARMRAFRNHGITTEHSQRASWSYEMTALGFNYRLSDLQCALGLSQLRKLPGWLVRRRAIAHRYTIELADNPTIEPPTVLPGCDPAWHIYVPRLRLERLRVGRERIFAALRAENVGVNVHYMPVPWHPYYQGLGYTKGQWPVAEAEHQRILTLPIFPTMTDRDVDDVLEAVNKVTAAYAV